MDKNDFQILSFIILAGTPPIITLSGKDFVTTLPAAIIHPSPIITPSRIVTFEPSQQFFPINIPFLVTPCYLINKFGSL